jgi:hypothetical protein
LLDLYRKAANPDSLRVAVMWQHGEEERLPAAVELLPNLELISVPFEASRGCNWARLNLQRRWRGEPYTLFLDSHHRFVRGWDRTLIEMHTRLVEQGIERPLITGYMPSYDPLTYPAGRRRSPYKIYPSRRESGLLVHLTSYAIADWRGLAAPIPAEFASAHFIFARGRFNEDLRWDPRIYFSGDEVAMSLRAHTHGYDLFHPHVIVGWHCYDRRSRIPHWDDHAGWVAQQEKSLQRLRRLFTGRLRGRYGLGPARTRQSYEERLMVPLVDAPP